MSAAESESIRLLKMRRKSPEWSFLRGEIFWREEEEEEEEAGGERVGEDFLLGGEWERALPFLG